MNVRGFQLRSGTISFTSGAVTLQMPRRTRGTSRCAIVGITYDADDPQDGLLVAITSFQVGARQYVQGDNGGVILGLLAGSAVPLGTGSGNAWAQFPYFPCSRQIGPDGAIAGNGIPLPGNKFAGGILIKGGELITISLAEVQAGSNPINQIVLHCVQFDDGPSDADRKAGKFDPVLEKFWDDFANKGIGQVYFQGSTITCPNGSVINTQVQQIIHHPYTIRTRRLEIRGEKTTTTAVAEDNFADDSVMVSTSTENNHELDPVSARTVFGNAALQYPGALTVDLEDGGRNVIQYSGPDPGADMVVRLVAIHEGVDEQLPFLCGPNPY